MDNQYVVYNGNIYCDIDCMCFDVDYGIPNVEDLSEDEWSTNDNWNSDDPNQMSLNDAMNILIRHNKWRRDDHVPNKYKMENPTLLGKAIEIAIDTISKLM